MDSCQVKITLADLEKLARKGAGITLFFLLQRGAGVVINKESKILLDAFESGCPIETLRFLKECGANTFGNKEVESFSRVFSDEEDKKEKAMYDIAQFAKKLSW